ncbi:hypothetical protein TNCV_3340411 [Trichonephila clavipes]|nr:hypothetical protein TNCV_3340411 [Trichonephila clavipes]
MANYSGCPKFPKPRKGTQENTNTYTNTVNIVRPGTSYSQATSTSNSTNTQQMAPHTKGTPAALVTNQANQFNLPTPYTLSMLTQHIGNATSLPPPPQPKQSKKSKNKEQRKKELHALFKALIEYEDD